MLLILAGVSIATLTGENGILTRAQDAAIETRASQVEEIVELWKTEIEMNEAYDNGNGTVKSEEELLQGLLDERQVYENEIDRENKIIKIGDRVINYKTKLQLTDIYVALYNDGTLVFNNKNEFDTSKLAEGWTIENIKGKKYELVFDPEAGDVDPSKLPQWIMNQTITKVDFKNKIVPEYTSYWFAYLSNLSVIENISNLDTSNVTNMKDMFNNCSGLTSVDVSGFNTSNVTDMNGMFYDCSGLTSIDVSEFNTSKVTDMIVMFGGCTSLVELDVSNFDITYMKTNPIYVQRMFQGITGKVTISSEWTEEMKEESEYKEQ